MHHDTCVATSNKTTHLLSTSRCNVVKGIDRARIVATILISLEGALAFGLLEGLTSPTFSKDGKQKDACGLYGDAKR